MGFLDHYTPRSAPAPSQPEPERRAVVSVPWNVGDDLGAMSHRPVTFDRAASFGAVFGAWRYLADQIATLPVHAYRDLGDRKQRMASLPQLFQQPAAQGTLIEWLYRAVVAMASRGNAVGIVTGRLTNDTDLKWDAGTDVDLVGYEGVWRDTTAADWTNSKFVRNVVTYIAPTMSKDN